MQCVVALVMAKVIINIKVVAQRYVKGEGKRGTIVQNVRFRTQVSRGPFSIRIFHCPLVILATPRARPFYLCGLTSRAIKSSAYTLSPSGDCPPNRRIQPGCLMAESSGNQQQESDPMCTLRANNNNCMNLIWKVSLRPIPGSSLSLAVLENNI